MQVELTKEQLFMIEMALDEVVCQIEKSEFPTTRSDFKDYEDLDNYIGQLRIEAYKEK